MLEFGTQINTTPFIMALITLVTILLFPDISLSLWASFTKKYRLQMKNTHVRKNKAAGVKLKKYYEIDMKKFR